MGQRGPVPKPIHLKLLAGNPGKRKLAQAAPLAPVGECPVCPDFLGAEAKAIWREYAPEVHRLGLLTGLDVAAFAGLCWSAANVQEAEAILAREGLTFTTNRGTIRPHPALAIVQKSAARFLELAKCFGMTPASRARLGIAPPAPAEPDPMDAYLRRPS